MSLTIAAICLIAYLLVFVVALVVIALLVMRYTTSEPEDIGLQLQELREAFYED